MSFSIRLQIASFLPLRAVAPTLLEAEAIESLLDDACEALTEAGVVELTMGGFGMNPWPVDTSYDLPILLEQLPVLVQALTAGEPGRLDLYGQGIEREVRFQRDGRQVRLECRSRTDWQPSEPAQSVELEPLLTMLRGTLAHFVDGCDATIPELADQPVWRNWLGPRKELTKASEPSRSRDPGADFVADLYASDGAASPQGARIVVLAGVD